MQTEKDEAAARKQRRYERYLALAGGELPESVDVGGTAWRKVKTFKHDFFAATGLYEDASGRQSVLKMYRPRSYMGLPYGLLSLWEARHEEKVYLALQDTGHVPKWIGRYGVTGIMHEFVPGKHLTKGSTVDGEFFPKLERLFRTMHQRGMAYLDTNKPDNILIGDDGNCYLIDFQITWVQPPFPLSLFTYPVFALFKDSDLYHMTKHQRKIFPDSMTAEEFERRRPWYIRIHRIFANPYRRARRAYLRKIEEGASNRPEGSARH